MGFLDVLNALTTTPERRQAHRVSQLQHAMAAAATAHARDELLDDLREEATQGQLRARIDAQEDAITQLTVAVGVLVQMLAETRTLDEEDYRWRVEATITNTAPEPEPPSEAGAAPTRAEPTITCKNCKQVVPRKDSEITARGVLCERCALASSL